MAPLLSKSHSAYRADVLLRWLDRGGEQFDYLVSPRVSGTEFASTDRSGRLRVTIEAVPALCCSEDGWLHPGAVAQLVDTFTSHAIVVAGGFPGVTISMAMHYTRKSALALLAAPACAKRSSRHLMRCEDGQLCVRCLQERGL